MAKKLIDLHKEWMETGFIGTPMPWDGGLCNLLPPKYKSDLDLLKRTDEDRQQASKEGLDFVFWASGLPKKTVYEELAYSYTPLRQTIVLLIAIMHNEY
jgi:hypothetical protein